MKGRWDSLRIRSPRAGVTYREGALRRSGRKQAEGWSRTSCVREDMADERAGRNDTSGVVVVARTLEKFERLNPSACPSLEFPLSLLL